MIVKRILMALTAALCLAGCTPSTAPHPDTPPQSEPPQSEAPQAAPEDLYWDSLTPRQQAASVLMLNYPGSDAAAIDAFLQEVRPAGIILMGDGVPADEATLAQSTALWQSHTDLPYLIAIDQEGGVVSRLDGDPAPSAAQLRDGDPLAVEEAFAARAEYLQSLGLNTNFGVIADFTADPDFFIYPRVLGTTPQVTSDAVAAAVEGESGHVLSVIKHFPGHGVAAADSHSDIPVSQLSYEMWASSVALPFESGIDAGVDMVMVGHLLFPDIAPEPASLSPRWHQILREDLGFEGVIVTDDMKMLRDSEGTDAVDNAIASLNAGSTLILDIGRPDMDAVSFANYLIDGIVAALESGDLAPETLRDASLRLFEVRQGLQ